MLEADAIEDSVALTIRGKSWKGTWWGLPEGNLIYNTCQKLSEHKDIICVKWQKGKRTFIHRNYWSKFIEQVIKVSDSKKLSPEAKRLYKMVMQKKVLSFELPKESVQYNKYKKSITELEIKQMCYVTSVHGESGAHHKQLILWSELFKQRKFKEI